MLNNDRTNMEFPLLGMLTLLFIGLKLTHQIGWSWWLVLAPLWGPFALFALIVLAMMLIVLIFD